MKKNIKVQGLEDMMMEVGVPSCSDYENREIVIDGAIDETCLSQYTMQIIRMNKDDDDMEVEIKDRKPIIIYIACYGGDAIAGMTLIDIIKASKTPIITVTFNAYSMGALIAMAGHYRFCYTSSSYLIHDGALSIVNSSGKARDMFNFFAVKSDKVVQQFILDHTKISKRLLTKNWRNDWYLDSAEALELGLADEILTEII